MQIKEVANKLVHSPLALIGTATIAVYFVFCESFLYRHFVSEPWHQKLNTAALVKAEAQRRLIDDYFQKLNTQLQIIAQDPKLFELLEQQDEKRLAEFKSLLRHQLPELADIKVVSSNSSYFSQQRDFVGVTLGKDSIRGAIPNPAAVKLHDWLIVMAVPVSQNDRVAGSLITNFSTVNITELLENADNRYGKTELEQQTRGFAPQIIASSGSGESAVIKEVPARGRADWVVRFTASEKLIAETAKPFLFFALSSTLTLLTALTLLFFLYRYILNRSSTEHLEWNEDDLSPEELNRLVQEKLNTQYHTKSDRAAAESQSPGEHNDGNGLRHVFRSYDIRGDASQYITPDFALRLGKSVASRVLAQGEQALLVGADGRTTSPELKNSLIEGILSTGCDVVDIGLVPTPILNFALAFVDKSSSGIMVTASHNPSKDNGFKIFYGRQVVPENEIANLHANMEEGGWPQGQGERSKLNLLPDYCAAIEENVGLEGKKLRIALDCANGAASIIAPKLMEALNCEVIPLYCEVDGDFPNHPPDPSKESNLRDLIAIVKHEGADLGLAFDGDGDRVVAVSPSGEVVWPDELMMVFSRDILSAYPEASIVFDIKSTRRLATLINDYGGNPVMWKTGHSNIRRKITETGALLGGEFSGHLFFNDRWFGFDDGLYAAARLIETLRKREQNLDEVLGGFEQVFSTAELRIPVPEEEKFALVDKIAEGVFPEATRITLDGLRLDYPDGWSLVRASNTSASLTVRFEARSESALARIKHQLRQRFSALLPDTRPPF